MTYPPLQMRNWRRAIEAQVPAKALRDLGNRLRYGRAAPLSDELLYVDPMAIKAHYLPDAAKGAPRFRRPMSGLVKTGDWDLSVGPTGAGPKFRAVVAHFRDGVPWDETGLYDEMLARIAAKGEEDGCRSLDDIKARYAALDRVADAVRAAGGLLPRAQMPGQYFRREHGGVLVHIGRDGAAIRTGGGQHRFALAQALGLPEMPVQVGFVHAQAVANDALAAYRR
ncbi:hypothetical protein ACS3SW_19970 [Roseobacteraceae bacterium S113]